MSLFRYSAVLAVLTACNKDDSDAFLPLDQVCVAHAEEICSAQQHCCDEPGDEVQCQGRVVATCEPQREQLTMEDGLHYDGELAGHELDALRTSLDDCAPPVPVASFFEGGAAQGGACQRDAQCQSFVCADGKCAAPVALLLCDY